MCKFLIGTPWLSILSLIGILAIMVLLHKEQDRLEDATSVFFDFAYFKGFIVVIFVGLGMFDTMITIQSFMTSEYCLKKLCGTPEERRDGGCGKCLGDLVCSLISWMLFFLAYAVVICTIVFLIVAVAIPILGVCFHSICQLCENNSSGYCQKKDGILSAYILNRIVEFIKEKEADLKINLNVKVPHFCETADQEDCSDIATKFCANSEDLVSISGALAVVSSLMVIFQMHFVIIARGNLVSAWAYQNKEAADDSEENRTLKSHGIGSRV